MGDVGERTGASRGEGVGRGLMKACVLAYGLNDRLGRMGYTDKGGSHGNRFETKYRR